MKCGSLNVSMTFDCGLFVNCHSLVFCTGFLRDFGKFFKDAKPLENAACTPRYGLTTLDDGRFCRLSYDVDPATVGPSHSWVFMSKGGDDFPYGGLSSCLVKWQNDATEMAEVNRQSNGQVAQTRRASKYYFIPAVTFSNRSGPISVRWHPSNFVFSVRGSRNYTVSRITSVSSGVFQQPLIPLSY